MELTAETLSRPLRDAVRRRPRDRHRPAARARHAARRRRRDRLRRGGAAASPTTASRSPTCWSRSTPAGRCWRPIRATRRSPTSSPAAPRSRRSRRRWRRSTWRCGTSPASGRASRSGGCSAASAPARRLGRGQLDDRRRRPIGRRAGGGRGAGRRASGPSSSRSGSATTRAGSRPCGRSAGPQLAIRIDANGAWDRDEAVAALRALRAERDRAVRGAGPRPRPARRAARRRPRSRSRSTSRPAHPGALDERYGDLVCLKIARCGGIAGTLAAAERARAAGYEVYLASTLDGPLGIAAALHCAAVIGPRPRVRAGDARAVRRRRSIRCPRATARSRCPGRPGPRRRAASTGTAPYPEAGGRDCRWRRSTGDAAPAITSATAPGASSHGPRGRRPGTITDARAYGSVLGHLLGDRAELRRRARRRQLDRDPEAAPAAATATAARRFRARAARPRAPTGSLRRRSTSTARPDLARAGRPARACSPSARRTRAIVELLDSSASFSSAARRSARAVGRLAGPGWRRSAPAAARVRGSANATWSAIRPPIE